MKRSHLLPFLLPVLVLAACSDDQAPTAPPARAEPGGPSFLQAAGHKVVNSLADPGDGTCNARECTLREAIGDPASTEVTFATGIAGTIILASPAAGGGQLQIGKTLTITGPGTGVTIRRRPTDPTFRILRIDAGVTATLTNLDLRNGKTNGSGGGLLNFGTLTLVKTTVAENEAAVQGSGIFSSGILSLTNGTVADNRGTGIDNHGSLTLAHSRVVRNTGAGMINYHPSTLTLTNCTVARNAGVGISNDGGTLTVMSSEVTENRQGGISAFRSRSTVSNARITGNSTLFSGGGIFAFNSQFTLTNSTVARNSAKTDGGGIANRDGSTFTVTNSTILGNSAAQVGGGIANEVQGRNDATITLTNSTVSGNSAQNGGGISNRGSEGEAGVDLLNSTVAFNSASQAGGGIHSSDPSSDVGLRNSLVARNTASTGPDVFDDGGFRALASSSLIGDGTGSSLANEDGNQVGNVAPLSSPIDPRLGLLADNGGPTSTHALRAGSPALDAAATPPCPATDQRGLPRPQGTACDIGSFERK